MPSRNDGTGGGSGRERGKSARQINAPAGGENFKLSKPGSAAMGGKSGSMKVIGPKSATTSISGLKLGPAEHAGPSGAPYINKNSY